MADAKRSTISTNNSNSTTSSSKSRKSKNELIRSLVGSYLKARNYTVTDRYRKTDLVLTQSTDQIVMNTAIKNEVSKVNSVLFSNIGLNTNPAQVDQHFAKFTKFIRSQPEAVRVELTEIVPPLLCHLYIDMLRGRDWRPAIEFLRKHAPLVGKTEPTNAAAANLPPSLSNQQQKLNGTIDEQREAGSLPPPAAVQSSIIVFAPASPGADAGRMELYKQLVHKLSQVTHLQEYDSDPLLVQFRSCQTQLRMRSPSIAALRQYLAKHGHSVLLQTLRTWFCFETVEDKNFSDYSPEVGGQRRLGCSQRAANGRLTNGGNMDVDESYPDAVETSGRMHEYDFAEHTERENERYLLLNGFTKSYVRHRMLETENGASGDRLCDDEEDDDTDEETARSVIGRIAEPMISDEHPESDGDVGALGGMFPRRLTTQERLRRLRESANKVALYQRPLCVYRLENVGHQLTSVAIDSNCCHVASGFEDSTIMLWSTNRSTQMGRKPYACFRDRQCSWNVTACDSRFSVSEDSDDDDDADDGDGERTARAYSDGTSLQEDGAGGSMFDGTSRGDRARMNKLLPPYNRRQTKRERWKKFLERRCLENTFSETGGVVLRGHSNAVTDLLFSEHGSLLVSTSRDCTMRAWTGHDYNCRAVYRGHSHPIWTLAESPTGLYLATGSRDTTARLWSTDRHFPLQMYVGHSQDVDTVAFHPNGNYLATGSADLTVRLWCVTSGKLFRIFTDCRQPVHRVCFSPDGKYLAAGGEENRVRIFDLAAGAQLSELKDHTAAITCVTWSPDSRHFVSSCADGTIRIWDAKRMLSTVTIASTASPSSSHAQYTQSAGNDRSHPINLNNGTINPKTNITFNSAQHHPVDVANTARSTSSSQHPPASGLGDSAAAASSAGSNPASSTATIANLLLAYSTGCQRVYRLHYNKLNGGLSCIGSS
ncbi:uncharacterized protein LOC131210353 [Anopheles bellator]|uniref:uncharacterized protein LOC131210353 n=1 Tax=Anopheles bellator TaxID=139047 RepID=UPI00264A135A|nr:uncharacterized protein LOC131210353 [Anopheles bellator]